MVGIAPADGADVERARFLAIGESDRYTLRLVKPAVSGGGATGRLDQAQCAPASGRRTGSPRDAFT